MSVSSRQAKAEPTEAQKAAGNYPKKHLKIHGLDVSIENEAGTYRSGVSPSGKPWQTKMNHDYGYVRGTEGADGDPVDCFIGKNPESEQVHIVNQIEPETGEFDEHKVMLGFDSQQDAEDGYLSNYEPDWKGLGSLKTMHIDEFKDWLKNGNTTRLAKANAILDEVEKELLEPKYLILIKADGHKYLRRTGTPGNYKYIYFENKGGPHKLTHDIAMLRVVAPELFEKVKRAEPGKGREIKLTRKEVALVLKHGQVGFVSAGRNPNDPEDVQLTDREVVARDLKLKAALVEKGLMFKRVKGKYGEEEESFMVMIPDVRRAEIEELGTKFNQDSVIYSDRNHNEMIFTTGVNRGKRHEGDGFRVLGNNADNFYSEVQTPRGKLKFSLNFNFDMLKALKALVIRNGLRFGLLYFGGKT